MMSWNGSWTWGNWVAMSLLMIVFWSVVVGAAVAVLRTRRTPADQPAGDPQRLLDQRLARGEIDDVEYRRRGELLRAASDSA